MSIESETLIPFQQARNEFPGRKRVGNATLHRWRLQGVRGCRLETLVVGGQRFTSREAIQRFVDAQNQSESAEPSMTAAERQARSAAARAVLAGRGI